MREKFETLQKIVVDAADEIGLTIQTTNVVGSTDSDAKQLAKFVIATCEELLLKFPWRSFLGTDPWVKTADGSYTFELLNDTDEPLIDSRLLKLGAQWRYLHSKGMTYDEDFRTYQVRISAYAFSKNRERNIDMNNEVIQT